jgi:hypothetical protein
MPATKTEPLTTLVPTLLTYDGLGVDLPGYINPGVSWNGWAVPYFRKEQVDALIAQNERNRAEWPDGLVTIRWGDAPHADHLYLDDPAYPDEAMEENPPLYALIDGELVALWSPGGFSWTWEEVLS